MMPAGVMCAAAAIQGRYLVFVGAQERAGVAGHHFGALVGGGAVRGWLVHPGWASKIGGRVTRVN